MEKYEKIENELYISKYGIKKIHGIQKKGNPVELWNKIKLNNELLNWAIKPVKDKFGERDLVNGLTICDFMLIDYDSVDKNIYQKLINLIYSNEQIARIVIDGYCNGGYSYLLMSLWNPNLKLTEEQKQFAVNEAMNKIGTTRYKQKTEEFSKKLEEFGITDNIVTSIDIDGCINPIGAKTKEEHMNYLFATMSDTQAHGFGDFDIRYWILRNPNWSIEEKQKLIMDFWADNEEYDETLEQWEWGIVNDSANYNENLTCSFIKDEMYEYTYEELLEFYGDKATADRIWKEIEFCKQMHQLRPQQLELEFVQSKILAIKNPKELNILFPSATAEEVMELMTNLSQNDNEDEKPVMVDSSGQRNVGSSFASKGKITHNNLLDVIPVEEEKGTTLVKKRFTTKK